MHKEKRFGWFQGFLIGGSIGALTAFLTAPRSGEKTRALIREKGEDLRDSAMQTIDDRRERLGEIADKTRRRVANLRNVGENVLVEQKEVFEKGVEKARKAVQDKTPAAA